jgi:hypothetical protein
MSYRILNAYIYDKSEDELMQELNSIRFDYLKFMREVIDKQADWFIKFGNSMYKRFAKRNEDILDKAVRVLEKSAYGVERGNPADFSASCTVIKHNGKIVLWFFNAFRFDDFKVDNQIFQRLKKNEYSYMDSGDFEFESEEEEENWNKRGEFWDAVFEKHKTNIPANMGLTYEFLRHDDIWDLACHLDQVYEKLHKDDKKKSHK